MKNIHLLPTDKPSRLHYSKVQSEEGISYKLMFNQEESKCDNGLLSGQRHIYITSNEKPKEGEWATDGKAIVIWCREYIDIKNKYNKIILTTDPKLIKDGVQAIDDTFLEWFVKNPSCDFVEWDRNYNRGNGKYYYKIIIPEVEPKQELEKELFELEQELDIPSSMRWHNSKPKQETLEEAAERVFTTDPGVPIDTLNRLQLLKYLNNAIKKEGFIAGAKWQAERMYSEEDVQNLIKIIEWYDDNSDVRPNWDRIIDGLTMFEWFEQFKKK